MSDNSGVNAYREENKHGIKKTRLEVPIGTTVLNVPKSVYNPTTGKHQDLTALSEDGYRLKFLAVWAYFNNQNTVNLSEAPVLTLDKDKWEFEETDGHIVAKSTNKD